MRLRWQYLLENMDEAEDESGRVFERLQDRSVRVSWKTEVRSALARIFVGSAFAPVLAECDAIHKRILQGRVFVALHMHAGDGNVHTNIPVNSDNYAMLHTANRAVAKIMRIARGLNGVISGEHGIGITKLEYLTEAELAPFRSYKQRVDPQDHFNKHKLMPQSDLRRAYTPSFGLLGHESLIMQQSDISSISDAIKDCLRCGKCKPVCATHVPRANLLYSPRDKILATSLLIEAFLYEEQTRRGVSIQHWDELSDVADHCTVCHKCATPCPVGIDFGDVSMGMRDLLRRMNKKRFNLGTSASMFFLNATHPQTIRLARKVMIDWGYKAQRLGNRALNTFAKAQTRRPPATTGKPAIKEQVIHFVNKRMPGGLPKRTARALLDIEDRNYVPIIRNPARSAANPKPYFISPAAARSACSPRWGSRPRPCCGMSACRPCCLRAICAAGIRSAAPASSTRPIRSSPTIACYSTALPIRSIISTSRPWWSVAGLVSINCKDMNSTAFSPAPKSWISMNICWRRVCAWKMSLARATCIMIPAIRR